MDNLLRSIPAVHELQKDSSILILQEKYSLSPSKTLQLIREVLDNVRQQIQKKEIVEVTNLQKRVMKDIENKMETWNQHRLTKVINATGTVLHTNLGRSRLSNEAIEHIVDTAKHYSNLEYNLTQGARGSRHDIVEELVKEVTGAEAALVVNNNAAAVFMILRCFAKGKEVLVSRGELVEIGGSFRVSSIMEESDARLIEVGTTNKTHLKDYANAITDQTAMLLKVHTSNFKMIGFTKSVDRHELIHLADDKGILFYEDLGSGVLYDFSQDDIGDEPVIQSVLKEGVHLVSFSGDKLIGGPQAGIIAGKKELIQKLKNHQLARVLRVDKLTLAGLEATLKAYAKHSKEALHSIPVIRDVLKSPDVLYQQALQFLERTKSFSSFTMQIKKDTSMVGGGTMPDVELETYGVTVSSKKLSSQELERKLRAHNPPIIARLYQDQIFLDFRTLDETEIDDVYKHFSQLNEQLHIM